MKIFFRRPLAASRRRRARGAADAAAEPAADAGPRACPLRLRTAFALAMASGVALWAAFPPLGWWPLAWAAPLGWLILVRCTAVPGKGFYSTLWLAGFLQSLVLFHFIRLPHWAANFGWIALSLYLGAYLPVFVALGRTAVHQLRVSVVWAAPMIWVGLELARGHLLSGFSMALLAHTQVGQPIVIQISDLAGAYGLSFVIMLTAACLARMLPLEGRRWALWPAAPAIVAVAALLVYGRYRLNEPTGSPADPRVARVALIQGSIDTVFELTPEEAQKHLVETLTQYRRLTSQAWRGHGRLDLVVWPESKFAVTDFIYGDDTGERAGYDPRYVPTPQQQRQFMARQVRLAKGLRLGEPDPSFQMLVGTYSVRLDGAEPENFNSALLISPHGAIARRYLKMHRVPFGEYVPLGQWFPWVYHLTPLPGALTPGKRPEAFDVAGLRMAPNICFESTVPHLIRRQVAQLTREGQPPDVLVNLSDDGWFWGSNCLDLHLACTIFRAVENRIPALVAANTGLSAWIDGNGRVLKRGPRRATQVIYAKVRPDRRGSLYGQIGDWPAWGCLGFCLVCAAFGLRRRWLTKGDRRAGQTPRRA